jgi:hypothetical protein
MCLNRRIRPPQLSFLISGDEAVIGSSATNTRKSSTSRTSYPEKKQASRRRDVGLTYFNFGAADTHFSRMMPCDGGKTLIPKHGSLRLKKNAPSRQFFLDKIAAAWQCTLTNTDMPREQAGPQVGQ